MRVSRNSAAGNHCFPARSDAETRVSVWLGISQAGKTAGFNYGLPSFTCSLRNASLWHCERPRRQHCRNERQWTFRTNRPESLSASSWTSLVTSNDVALVCRTEAVLVDAQLGKKNADWRAGPGQCAARDLGALATTDTAIGNHRPPRFGAVQMAPCSNALQLWPSGVQRTKRRLRRRLPAPKIQGRVL